MPSCKPQVSSAAPAAKCMSNEEARNSFMDLWSSKQMDAAKAGNEMMKAERLREVEALSVAMTALEVVTWSGPVRLSEIARVGVTHARPPHLEEGRLMVAVLQWASIVCAAISAGCWLRSATVKVTREQEVERRKSEAARAGTAPNLAGWC